MRYLILVAALALSGAAVSAKRADPNDIGNTDRATTGLPSLFWDDQVADRSAAFKLRTTDGDDLSEVTERIERVEHRDGDSTSAIVGIMTENYSNKGVRSERHGSGFFVDACHVATAGHVAMPEGVLPGKITVGWGSRPSTTREPANWELAPNFSHLSEASVVWIGTTTLDRASLNKLDEETAIDRDFKPKYSIGKAGANAAGDWAILRVKSCRSRRDPTFALPNRPSPFIYPNYGPGMIYWAALGYPQGEYDKIAITRCAVVNSTERGARTACQIRGGNSGGPLLYSTTSTLVSGITSYTTGKLATFIPAGTAGFALRQPAPSPPPAGCVTNIKRQLLPSIRKTDPTAALDETVTPVFKYYYYHLAARIAQTIGAPGGAILPTTPDPFWCSVITAVTGDGPGSLDPGVPAGEWHWNNLGVRVEKSNGQPKVTLTGSFFKLRQPLANVAQVSRTFGRRVYFVVEERSGSGREPDQLRFIIDFMPGRPPLFASIEENGQKNAVMQWFEPGAAVARN